VTRYQKGEFGNAGPTWLTVQDWLDDPQGHGTTGWNGPRLFHLRNKVPGGPTFYDLTVNQVLSKVEALQSSISDFYLSEMAPTSQTLIQGEVKRGLMGLELRYSQERMTMRAALQTSQETTAGLRAVFLLRKYLDASSYDWLMELLDLYQNHIVEFSTYSVCWGTLPNRNTVFWEVRPDRSFCSNLSPFTEVY